MNALPLLPDAPPDTRVAWHRNRPVTRAEFLGKVLALAAALPDEGPVINLCSDRYHFALGFFASICRGRLSLLPNALTRDTIARLQDDHPALHCLHDQAGDAFGLPVIPVAAEALDPRTHTSAPMIPAGQEVACVFTSGSTGRPNPHFKRWGSLLTNIRAEAGRLWDAAGGACAVLGTVPFQHMYGLESTVLLPLLGGGMLCAQRPFFPGDIATALAELPAPRLLVTTPFHLRALLDADLTLPPLDLIVSATAPLATELAQRAESTLGAALLEIYGATETGQIATRRTTTGEPWHCFDGIALQQHGHQTLVSGGHIEQACPLNDIVTLEDATHFRLVGRGSDMINIAGKRSSLAYLNHVLNSVEGVRDGTFCLPDPDAEAARLAAFVVAPGMTVESIQRALRVHLDPIFLPRPIVFLDQLPRNTTGKLPHDALQALIQTHLGDLRA
jgi:acyl-coenzyme A synthetase/AMP-(fatty) acid ligase